MRHILETFYSAPFLDIIGEVSSCAEFYDKINIAFGVLIWKD